MAKVKITGHASGTGVVTVTAPNTSTDRTITLPDATATIATTTDVAARLPSITDGGNATAITIDASEKVGIGTTSPQRVVQIQGVDGASGVSDGNSRTSLVLDNNGANYINILTNTSGNGAVFFSDNGSNNGGMVYETPNDDLYFKANNVERLRITSNGRGLSQFTAKAWIHFNMSNATIADSHNISTITDSDVGDFNVNFSTNMTNSVYSALADGNAVSDWHGTETAVISTASSQFRVIHKENNVSRDSAYTGAIVFGD